MTEINYEWVISRYGYIEEAEGDDWEGTTRDEREWMQDFKALAEAFMDLYLNVPEIVEASVNHVRDEKGERFDVA